MAKMKVRSKIWIEVDGRPLFGRGRRFLLEAIDRHGSINRAAKEINITYRKAWSYVNAMEDRLGFALVERRKGGRGGGGTTLTTPARDFLERFRRLEDGFHDYVDGRFTAVFDESEADVRSGETTGEAHV